MQPMNISVKEEYYYFITFIDDLLMFGYIYFMKYKSESFEIFKRFYTEVEKQTGKSIKILQSDRRGEYLTNEFLTYLEEKGFSHNGPLLKHHK